MKRRYYIGFLLLQMLYPVCVLVGNITNRVFVLANESIYLILISVCSLWLTWRIWHHKRSYWAFPSVFLAVINVSFLLFNCRSSALLVVFLLPICGWFALLHMPKDGMRIVAAIVSGLFTVLFLMALPVMLFGIAMAKTTEVFRVDSPEGRYTATVEENDQGALGGDTVVLVQDNARTLSMGIGSYFQIRDVYWADWGEWQDMELSWQDEDVLVINGIAYSVSQEDLAAIGNIEKILGADIQNGVLLKSEDSHGGFLGDGMAYAEIRCALTIPDSEYWHKLPLSGNLSDLVSRNGLLCSSDRTSLVPPEIRNGYYFFMDEFDGKSPDDAMVLGRYSYNFTLALYDADTGMLYFYEMDT